MGLLLARRVHRIDEHGRVDETFNSAGEAARSCGKSPKDRSYILKVCKKNRLINSSRFTAYGHAWRFADDSIIPVVPTSMPSAGGTQALASSSPSSGNIQALPNSLPSAGDRQALPPPERGSTSPVLALQRANPYTTDLRSKIHRARALCGVEEHGSLLWCPCVLNYARHKYARDNLDKSPQTDDILFMGIEV